MNGLRATFPEGDVGGDIVIIDIVVFVGAQQVPASIRPARFMAVASSIASSSSLSSWANAIRPYISMCSMIITVLIAVIAASIANLPGR